MRRLPNRHRASGWPAYAAGRAATARSDLLRTYYAAGCPLPDTPIADVPLVALDMETTGLDERRHAIVSIGLVPFSLQRIAFAARQHWIVRPPRDLNSRSVTLHHITHSDIERAPDLADVLPDLLEALTGRVAVVHYRNIERPFLDAAVRARLGESLLFPVIDTMELEARRYRSSLRARLRRNLGLAPISIRLADSRTRYGLPYYQSHNALLDAVATAELLQAQIATHYHGGVPLGSLWR